MTRTIVCFILKIELYQNGVSYWLVTLIYICIYRYIERKIEHNNSYQSDMNMNTLNNKNINILDLPDEILFIIFNKLHMTEMFYSLVNVNQRFDRLVLDPMNHLCFILYM